MEVKPATPDQNETISINFKIEVSKGDRGCLCCFWRKLSVLLINLFAAYWRTSSSHPSTVQCETISKYRQDQDFSCRTEDMTSHKTLAWCPGTTSPGHLARTACRSRRCEFWGKKGEQPPASSSPFCHLLCLFTSHNRFNLFSYASSMKLQFLNCCNNLTSAAFWK